MGFAPILVVAEVELHEPIDGRMQLAGFELGPSRQPSPGLRIAVTKQLVELVHQFTQLLADFALGFTLVQHVHEFYRVAGRLVGQQRVDGPIA